FEQIGEDVVNRLELDIQTAVLSTPPDDTPIDPNKVVKRLDDILQRTQGADFIVRNQINPQKMAEALRRVQIPNWESMSPAEHRLLDDSIKKAAHYIYRTAAKLPGFDALRAEDSVQVLYQVASEISDVLDDARAIHDAVVSRPLTSELEYETS